MHLAGSSFLLLLTLTSSFLLLLVRHLLLGAMHLYIYSGEEDEEISVFARDLCIS